MLESNFYAWRVTGNQTYLERARSAVKSFNGYLSTSTGFAGIYDVNDLTTPWVDETESFWFAEVLKYLQVISRPFNIDSGSNNSHARRYLTFDDPNRISLDNCKFHHRSRGSASLILIINSCFVKLYSTPRRIRSWPHRRKITMAVASSPHQRLATSCYALGRCLLSAKWLGALSEDTGMHVYVQRRQENPDLVKAL